MSRLQVGARVVFDTSLVRGTVILHGSLHSRCAWLVQWDDGVMIWYRDAAGKLVVVDEAD